MDKQFISLYKINKTDHKKISGESGMQGKSEKADRTQTLTNNTVILHRDDATNGILLWYGKSKQIHLLH